MQINKPKGVFSASRISELLATGSGKTKQSYIYDICLDILGLKINFENEAMRHGVATEQNAFDDVVSVLFENAVYQSDIYLPINENCGASPDVLIDKNCLDIKCPTIEKFHSYNWNIPKSYKDQIQMQLLATGGDIGYLLFFLQKPITYDNADSWQDYDFDNFDDNYILKEFKKDEEKQEEILKAVEISTPIKYEMLELLKNAEEVDFKYLCNYARSGGQYAKLKESNNILKENIFLFDNQYFFFKNK
jgi:hypothetical protein